MKPCLIVAACLLLFACSTTPHASAPAIGAVRTYSGTASVGDFLSISLDSNAHTLSYTNYTNHDSGTIPYTENTDGTYTLNDPHSNLLSAYEVPNYGMVVEAAKAGINHDTPALITAVRQVSISLADLEGRQFNYMQFRTSGGGLEAGSVTLDTNGNVSVSGYWPYGAMGMGRPATPLTQGAFPATAFQADASGTFLKMTEGGGTDYIFGTPNGVFVVDTPNGAILGFKKAAVKDFRPTYAGAYKAVYYQKTGANVDPNNFETGTPTLGRATVVIDTSGEVTVFDAGGEILLQASLTPVADATYLYGATGPLQDPCYGMFTFRVNHGSTPQDVFATFLDGEVLFSSFAPASRGGGGRSYDYLYGVGLK
jgi:hypothetical protein